MIAATRCIGFLPATALLALRLDNLGRPARDCVGWSGAVLMPGSG